MIPPAAIAALILPARLRDAIAAATRAAAPEECCGLLVGAAEAGTGGEAALRVTRVVPSPNLADDRRRRFEVDPQLWLNLRNELAEAGGAEEIVGCYHSHPEGPAEPSARDLADAWEPGFAWLIAAPAADAGIAITAWLFEDDGRARRFRPLALRGDKA